MKNETKTESGNGQLLLTVRAAAKTLAISESLLWKHTAPRGNIPCVKIGRAVRYRPADLERWAERTAAESEREACDRARGDTGVI